MKSTHLSEPTTGRAFQQFISSLSKCGLFLLQETDDTIEHNVFLELDLDVREFFYEKTLQKLADEWFIDQEMADCARNIREKVISLDGGPLWNIAAVRTSPKWREIMVLSDNLKEKINKKWTDEELIQLYNSK